MLCLAEDIGTALLSALIPSSLLLGLLLSAAVLSLDLPMHRTDACYLQYQGP